MERLGTLYLEEEESCGIFWEHRATDIAISAVSRLRMLLPQRSHGASVAVGGAPPCDSYILPSLCAAAVLESQGFNAVNLGPQSPFGSLLLARESVRASLLWLSVSMIDDLEDLRSSIDSLLAGLEADGVPLIIGGSKAGELMLAEHPLLHVGESMRELEALVKGFRAAIESKPLEQVG